LKKFPTKRLRQLITEVIRNDVVVRTTHVSQIA